MKKYIIFGGTFDPIHNGHIKTAIAAKNKFDADIIFVPAKHPRWKAPNSDPNDRLNMLKLAVESTPELKGSIIEEYELNSDEDINYTINTVRYLLNKYHDDKLYLLIGTDQVNQFDKWQEAVQLASLAKVIYVDRPGYILNKDMINRFKMESIEYFDSGDVSSTDVRELRSIDIPDVVREYIEKNRLYYVSILEKYLDDKRLDHSISVANLAYKIALSNKLDRPERAYIAGILHDIGKSKLFGNLAQIEFMKKNYPDDLDLPTFSYHQFLGVELAKKEFEIDDEEILDAIKYHCTGKANMSVLGKIVYASDKIEPTRAFDSTWLINSCLKDYNQGFLDTLTDNKKYLLAHNKDIMNKYTKECMDQYLK